MQKFNCRSPFIVSVNGSSTQIATRVNLVIKNQTGTTTLGTYNLTKTKYSDTQYINYYNISPYCYDLLKLNVGNPEKAWLKLEIKTYYTNTSNVETNIATYNCYTSLGFSLYGINQSPGALSSILLDTLYRPLFNQKIYYSTDISYPKLTYAVDNDTYRFRLRYLKGSTLISTVDLAQSGIVDFYNSDMTLLDGDSNFFEIQQKPIIGGTFTTAFRAELIPVCEVKYSPLLLTFINRYGGLQSITLFKNSTQSIEVKSSNYNTNSFLDTKYPDYDVNYGQTRIYNKNGKYNIKVNTGWVDENFNEFIEDIMLSEYLSLYYKDKGTGVQQAVTLKDTSMLYKSHLNEKVINYELNFEVANSIINNVV
jgi:hypothetical protein